MCKKDRQCGSSFDVRQFGRKRTSTVFRLRVIAAERVKSELERNNMDERNLGWVQEHSDRDPTSRGHVCGVDVENGDTWVTGSIPCLCSDQQADGIPVVHGTYIIDTHWHIQQAVQNNHLPDFTSWLELTSVPKAQARFCAIMEIQRPECSASHRSTLISRGMGDGRR